MRSVSINILKTEINHKAISDAFEVVQFTTSENYIPFGAKFIDSFSQKLLAKSVVFESGRSLFTLFAKAEFDKINLRKELDTIEGADSLRFKKLLQNELVETPQYLLIQLLLNSLITPSHERLRFNNLTGKLYLFNESLFERRKFKEDRLITKIPALEFKVQRDLSLDIRTTTFSSLLLKSKLDFSKKPLTKYAKYSYTYATQSMRRILDDEKLEAKDVFIIKQEPGKKIVIPFMDFGDLDSFLESKMGFLASFFKRVNQKLNEFITLRFEEREIDNVHRKSDSLQENITDAINKRNYKIHIVNTQCEMGNDYVEAIKSQLFEILGNRTVTISDKIKKESLNIRLVHNRQYYENKKIKDIYNPSLDNTQHLTIEDFTYNNASVTRAILKELLIKNDIHNRQLSLADWSLYGFKDSYVFGSRKEDTFHFLIISPTGKLNFQVVEPTLFNQSEFDDLVFIFEGDETVEGIVKNDLGHINVIKKTRLFTLPKFQDIHNQLTAENEDVDFKKPDIKKWLTEIDISEEQNAIFGQAIESYPDKTLSKSDILKTIDHRTVKKKLVQHIYDHTGILLKTYMRDKTKYELFDSNLDIHTYKENGKLFYYVGVISEGMRRKITRASVIREISVFGEGSLFFDQLLPLLNVDFVRYGDLTAKPFPFKYLREWYKIMYS